MLRDPAFLIALSLSLAATVACWVKVIKSEDPRWFKVLVAFIAAIPFLGPVLFLFINHPPSLPESAMARGEWAKGVAVRSHITHELSAGYRKYLNALYGVGAPNPLGKRRERRKKAR